MTLWVSTVSISHPILGGTGSNTWHGRSNAGPLDIDLAVDVGMIDDMIQAFYEDVSPILADGTNVHFDGLWTTVDEEEASILTTAPWDVDVVVGGSFLPPANCIVAGWRTTSPTRGGRGRTFLGPLKNDTADTNGTITDTALAVARDAAEALVTSSTGFGNGALGVYSRAGVANPADPGVHRDFTGSVVHDKFAVLRSRRD